MFIYALNCKCGYQTIIRFPVFSSALTAYCRSCGREAGITFLHRDDSEQIAQKSYLI